MTSEETKTKTKTKIHQWMSKILTPAVKWIQRSDEGRSILAKDDGVLNPNTIRIGPRRRVFAQANLKPLPTGDNFIIVAREIERPRLYSVAQKYIMPKRKAGWHYLKKGEVFVYDKSTGDMYLRRGQ